MAKYASPQNPELIHKSHRKVGGIPKMLCPHTDFRGRLIQDLAFDLNA